MAYNGSGIFNRLYSWVADAAAGINILADRMDAEMDGFATGLSTCLTRDGQAPMEANLDAGGFHVINMADPVNNQDAVTKLYAQNTYLPLAGGIVKGIVKIDANNLTPLQLFGRDSDKLIEMDFREPTGDPEWRWTIRANPTETGTLGVRHNDVEMLSIGAEGNITAKGSSGQLVSGPNGVVSKGVFYLLNDGAPLITFANAAAVRQANIYLDRTSATADRPGLLVFTLTDPDGTDARVVGRLQDSIAKGGTLDANFSVVTREHGDARYTKIADYATEAEAIAGTATNKLMSPALVQARTLETVGASMTGVQFFTANLVDDATEIDVFVENLTLQASSNLSCTFQSVTNTVRYTRQNLVHAAANIVEGEESGVAMIPWPGNIASPVAFNGMFKFRRTLLNRNKWWGEVIVRGGNTRMLTCVGYFALSGEPTSLRVASANTFTAGNVSAVSRR